MTALKGLPGWARRMDEVCDKFSPAGFHGLVDHSALTNQLGELLTNGTISPHELEYWIHEMSSRRPGHDLIPPRMRELIRSPKATWEKYWAEILGREVVLPEFPRLKPKTKRALEQFGLVPMFLLEAKYLVRNVGFYFSPVYTPGFEDYYDIPLPGCWILVETIGHVNHSEKYGNRHGVDPLARNIDLSQRYDLSWENLEQQKFPLVAKLLGLPTKAVRLPTVKEWNLIAHLFDWLNWCTNSSMNLPSLGDRSSGELTSTFHPEHPTMRCTIGDSVSAFACHQSREIVRYTWPGDEKKLGWRILVTLGRQTENKMKR